MGLLFSMIAADETKKSDEKAHITIPYVYKGIKYPSVVLSSSIEAMKTFDVRPDDVYIVCYPKSGTHWVMEIAGLILNDGDPLKIDRSTWSCIEMINIGASKLPKTRAEELANPVKMTPMLDVIERAPSPRIMRSHLQMDFLPPDLHKRAKVIYVARNPKDTINSYYNFLGNTQAFGNKSFGEVVEDFLQEDDFRYGPWFDHVMGGWEMRNEENVLFLFYEDLKKDPMKNIDKVAKLLGRTLSEEMRQRILEHSSLSGMQHTYKNLADKAAKSGKYDPTRIDGKTSYIKKGTIGQWKSRLTVEMNEKFDDWYWRKVAGTGLDFNFEP